MTNAPAAAPITHICARGASTDNLQVGKPNGGYTRTECGLSPVTERDPISGAGWLPGADQVPGKDTAMVRKRASMAAMSSCGTGLSAGVPGPSALALTARNVL